MPIEREIKLCFMLQYMSSMQCPDMASGSNYAHVAVCVRYVVSIYRFQNVKFKI